MFRLAIPALLLIGLLATPTVRAKFPDPEAPKQSPLEKILSVLHTEKLRYEKDVQVTPFPEVLKDLSSSYGITFIVNMAAFGDQADTLGTAKSEKFATTKTNGLGFKTFFDTFLRGLPVENVTYLVRTDHIEITSKLAAAKEAGLTDAESEAAATGDMSEIVRARARFNLPLVCLAAKQQSIASVFEDLRRVYGLNIVVSKNAAELLKTPITVQLLNVPADVALELLAEKADLDAVRKGNTFRIIPKPGV